MRRSEAPRQVLWPRPMATMATSAIRAEKANMYSEVPKDVTKSPTATRA